MSICSSCCGNRVTSCTACDGNGNRYYVPVLDIWDSDCSVCHGSGLVTCTTCHGTGVTSSRKTVPLSLDTPFSGRYLLKEGKDRLDL